MPKKTYHDGAYPTSDQENERGDYLRDERKDRAIGRELITPEDYEEWQCACEEAADFHRENTPEMPQS